MTGASGPLSITLSMVLSSLLMGCPASEPHELKGIEIVGDTKLEYQSKAMFTAQYMVEDQYGEDFGDLLGDTNVYWTDTLCPSSDKTAVLYRDECYKGLTWGCSEIYVAVSDDDPSKVSGTALLHEYGHCMYIQMFGHGDAPHEDYEFWSIINQADIVAADRDW